MEVQIRLLSRLIENISPGLDYNFKLGERDIRSIIVGAGFLYSIPGNLNRTENSQPLGTVNYSSNLGYFFDTKLSLNLSENLLIEPRIRVRLVKHVAKSSSVGEITDLPDHPRPK